MALFANTAASCLFAVQAIATASPTVVALSFDRPVRSLNSLGEVSLYFASAWNGLVDLQPGAGSFVRFVQGQIEMPKYTGVIAGYVTLQDMDRTSVYSALLEITNVGHYGTFQTEIALRVVR